MDQWGGSRRAEAVRRYAAHVRMLISLTAGDFEEAYLHGATVAPAGSLPPFVGQALWMFMDTVEAAVRTGRGDLALDHVRVARAAGLDAVSPRLAMVLLGSAGLAAHDDAEAVLRFGEAMAIDGAERWPFELARIRLYCGERLRRGRAPAEARRHLGAAAEIFVRLGAEPWAERARKELRACGGRAAVPARSGTAALTPQQWEIARLAAAGLSNKEIGERLFLSPRTVSTHLYRLFPKLGVSSRGGLRDALAQVPPK
jgi:DNA-binding CsgD family transcriptional regulator